MTILVISAMEIFHGIQKLFYTLNERARREQRAREAREEELYRAWATDPRRDHVYQQDLSRIYPLIEDE